MDLWETAPISARLPDGKVLLATFNRDGTQIFAKVRHGKVVQIGQQSKTGSFKALKPQKSLYCFIPDVVMPTVILSAMLRIMINIIVFVCAWGISRLEIKK